MTTVEQTTIMNGETDVRTVEYTAEQWDKINDENIGKPEWTGEIGLDGARTLVLHTRGCVLVLREVK